MELYWPEEGFPNHSGNFPLQPPHALSHTSAGSARGSLDSAENLLPLASCLIKKLAGDQKKKNQKKTRTMFSYKTQTPDLHCPTPCKSSPGFEITPFASVFLPSTTKCPKIRSCPKCPKLHFLVWRPFQNPNLIFFPPLFLNGACDLQPLELVYHEDALGRAMPSENQ